MNILFLYDLILIDLSIWLFMYIYIISMYVFLLYYQKLQKRAGDFGMDLLEELVVPLNPVVDISKCKSTVRLNVTGSDDWGPSLPDQKWNAAKKQMTEVCFGRDIFRKLNDHCGKYCF